MKVTTTVAQERVKLCQMKLSLILDDANKGLYVIDNWIFVSKRNPTAAYLCLFINYINHYVLNN